MKNNNYQDKSKIQSISNFIKYDIVRYEKFINHNALSNVYKTEFLDSFFDFLNYLQEFDQEKQIKILENPLEYNINLNFGIYMDIFTTFLKIYSKKNYNSLQSLFDIYFEIINDLKKTFIEETKQQISQVMDPKYTYDLFQMYIKKYGLDFYDILDLISNEIGSQTPLIEKSFSINDITGTLKDFINEEERLGIMNDLGKNILEPFLLSNIYICQKYLSEKNKEKMQTDNNKENQDSANKKYYQVINYLKKQKNPIKFELNQTLIFSFPLQNSRDFDIVYNDFLSFIGSELFDPDYSYPDGYNTKNLIIEEKDYLFELETGKKISAMELITILNYEVTDREYDEDDEQKEKVEIVDEILDDILEQIDQLSSEEESDEIDEKIRIAITNKVKKQLPSYFQMNIYIGFDPKIELITFTIKLEEYTNVFDEYKNRKQVKLNPLPIIIKTTFAINNNANSDFTYNFINFLELLSSNYDIFESIGLKNDL